MDTSLPLILEGIERAATDARKAAYDATTSGKKAAEEAMKSIRKIFLKIAKDITEELEK